MAGPGDRGARLRKRKRPARACLLGKGGRHESRTWVRVQGPTPPDESG